MSTVGPDIGPVHHRPATEKPMNRLGYIPLVSTISGIARCADGILGLLGDAVGWAGGCGAFAVSLLIPGKFGREYRAETKSFLRSVVRFTVKDTKKVFRGIIEAIPIIGNLSCYGWDKTESSRQGWYANMRGRIGPHK